MSFLLKIVEGPNKGAEIALVDGVSVTFGKGDECDIVLADPTLPDAPLTIETSADSVAVGGEPLAPYAVKTLGSTSIAVGPAGTPWGPLVWPEKETDGQKAEEAEAPEAPANPGGEEAQASPEPREEPDGKKRRGLGCAILAVALVVLILAILWFFRGAVSRGTGESGETDITLTGSESLTLSGIAAKHGLELDGFRLTGNFATRRERLAATAEIYASNPGVELDLSDDESFRTSCEDALFTLSEGALKVLSATNRVLAVAGESPSPEALAGTLAALSSDLPKLRDVDVSNVRIAGIAAGNAGAGLVPSASGAAGSASGRKSAAPVLPVCGILTAPYPCLVLKNGARVMEGAPLGDWIVAEIGADSVVVTNSAGSFTWRP